MSRLREPQARALLILICVFSVHRLTEAQHLGANLSGERASWCQPLTAHHLIGAYVSEGAILRPASVSEGAMLRPTAAAHSVAEALFAAGVPQCPTSAAQRATSLDQRLLFDIYGIQNGLFTATMTAADYSAYPVMYGAVPSAWLGSVLTGSRDDRRSAIQLTLAWGLSAGSSVVLKHLVRRPRPFEVERGIGAKTGYVGARHIDRYSFPSGHAAITAAIVTTLSLSYPHWYVVVPGMAFASSVSLSRIWLGVHYPSDVVSGIFLGVAAGSLAYVAGDHLFE